MTGRAKRTQQPLGPLFLSVGAMKAGTTWLFRALKRHPDLGFAHEKELAYFYALYCAPKHLSLPARVEKASTVYLTRQVASAKPEVLPERMRWIARYIRPRPVDDAWYKSLFPQNVRWRCDFSNLHALLNDADWGDLAQRSDLRVLYTLRDPMARYWSQTRFQLIQSGALANDAAPDADMLAQGFASVVKSGHGNYANVLTQLHNGLGRERVLVQIHEDRHAAPLPALREIEAFLDLDPADYPPAILNTSVNVTGPDMAIPEAFRALARRQVLADLDALAATGLPVPPSWERPG